MFGGTACDVGYISFKDIESMWRNWFNAYWYIDRNGHFRIEHIYFFDPAFAHSDFEVDINLKTLISSNGKSFAYRRNKYSYETGMLYDQEHWSMQHYDGTEGTIAHGTDFSGQPIYYNTSGIGYKSDCVPGEFKEKEYATPRFWSDIFWADQLTAAGTPDTIRCPGFSILVVDPGTMWVRCEVGAYGGANVINGHLAIANLQNNYHQHERIFLTGRMNFGGATPVVAFLTEIKKKLQEAIEFEHCCDEDFDPLDYIRTELGDGAVKAAIEKKRSIEIELLY